MTKTITIHIIRPTLRWYEEKPCESFGFSGRAAYALGFDKPNYPVPAIDYYNSSDPTHKPIGNLMECTIPIDIQLQFRS